MNLPGRRCVSGAFLIPSVSWLSSPLLRIFYPGFSVFVLGVSMSEYNAVPPPGSGAPLGGQAALGNGAGGVKKDAFADAVQRARQVRCDRSMSSSLVSLKASIACNVFTHNTGFNILNSPIYSDIAFLNKCTNRIIVLTCRVSPCWRRKTPTVCKQQPDDKLATLRSFNFTWHPCNSEWTALNVLLLAQKMFKLTVLGDLKVTWNADKHIKLA